MNKLYQWIDRLWQWIAETIFVRFEFSLPVEELRAQEKSGRLIFALTHGGVVEWLILSSWCRSQGLGAILVSNRRRILLFAKPAYFFAILFRRKSYSDLFLSAEMGPRLMFCPSHERKRPFDPTPVERLLADLYSSAAGAGTLSRMPIYPVFVLWRKHMRGGARALSEYLFGLSSNPNIFGKLWYLLRARMDSTVRALVPITMGVKETLDYEDAFDDSEAMRIAKHTRRRILVANSQEMRVVVGPRYLSPHLVKETLMRDPEMQAVIREVAEKEGVDRKKIMSRAYQNLTEIVSNYRFRFIEVMYVFLTWLFTRVFDGVVARDSELQEVREVMKTKPVVFVPCHRSHLDYLIIPYLLFLHDMVTPHTAAGINLSFWPVGPFLRRGGAFFIRRSFRGDPLYSANLRKYVEYLLKNRCNVKFFIEGTRSRSGKMLAPAYGMLKMVMEICERRVIEDVALIPVSLCYDEVPEQGSYTKELTGGAKVKESAKELVKSRKLIKRNIGKVYVRFSRSLSARDVLSAASSQGMAPTLMLQKTAFQICKSINDVTPVTPKSIVCSTLLGHGSSSVTLEEILRLSTIFGDYVSYSGFPLSVEPGDAFKRAVEQTVRRLQKSGVVTISDSVPRAYHCEGKKRVLLNFYKNNAIHCLIMPSIAFLAFHSVMREHGVVETGVFREAFEREALWMRNFLKFEFFFSPTRSFLDSLHKSLRFFTGEKTFDNSLVPDLADAIQANFQTPNERVLLMRLLGELLESYLTALKFLQEPQAKGSIEKKAWVQKVLKHAEATAATKPFLFPESVSLQNYTNALQLFENLRLVSFLKEPDKVMVVPQGASDEIEILITKTSSLLELMNPKSA